MNAQDYDVRNDIFKIIQRLVTNQYRDFKSWLIEIKDNNKIDFLTLLWLDTRSRTFGFFSIDFRNRYKPRVKHPIKSSHMLHVCMFALVSLLSQ